MTTTPSETACLASLRASAAPLDAYQLAKRTGLSAMECGRAVLGLVERQAARFVDAAGTINDLACRVRATS